MYFLFLFIVKETDPITSVAEGTNPRRPFHKSPKSKQFPFLLRGEG